MDVHGDVARRADVPARIDQFHRVLPLDLAGALDLVAHRPHLFLGQDEARGQVRARLAQETDVRLARPRDVILRPSRVTSITAWIGSTAE